MTAEKPMTEAEYLGWATDRINSLVSLDVSESEAESAARDALVSAANAWATWNVGMPTVELAPAERDLLQAVNALKEVTP